MICHSQIDQPSFLPSLAIKMIRPNLVEALVIRRGFNLFMIPPLVLLTGAMAPYWGHPHDEEETSMIVYYLSIVVLWVKQCYKPQPYIYIWIDGFCHPYEW